ncbi:hypothetical protein NL676_030313 [Syzygium grande]|nr:hypothetical protein NL676_030313 [Syzygium grande]
MRMAAYWKIVLRRFVDSMALHLPFSFHNLVNEEMEKEIVGELIRPNGSGSIERMLEEAPSVAAKREKLNKSINLLRESAKVVANIMDRIAADGDWPTMTETSNLTTAIRRPRATAIRASASASSSFPSADDPPSLPPSPPLLTLKLELVRTSTGSKSS